MVLGPYAPDAQTARLSVFSHYFNGLERLPKLAVSSLATSWSNGFTGLAIILAHGSRSTQGAGPFHYDQETTTIGYDGLVHGAGLRCYDQSAQAW